jgi:hypothetical protein
MSEEAVQASGQGRTERPPLDDLMLAMDVVDTLRRRERLVERELDEIGRAEDLIQRLQRIYAQQGIDVPDHVIEQGVAALKEDRFTYKPPAGGLARRLALLYVNRGRWGKWVGGGAAVALLAVVLNHFAFVAPEKALPGELSERHQAVLQIAATEHARSVVEQVRQAGTDALNSGNLDGARAAIDELGNLQDLLQQEFVIQIVNRPGERTGVWRVPDVNQKARNLYVVVEAVTPTGNRVKVPISSEETGQTERVDTWGLRVEQATYDAVRRDKEDDGIIENDRFGYKKRGHLNPDYEMPTSGGAITRW